MPDQSESASAYVAVLTHIPSSGETFYTPFDSDDAGPRAMRFRESEEKRGDFPGSLWTIVANEAGRRQMQRERIARMVGDEMADRIMEDTP